MYEGGIRVPAIAVWPDNIEPGIVSNQILMTMDIFPTVCEIAGVGISHTIDGQSFLDTLLGRSEALENRTFYFVLREGGTDYRGLSYHAVRKGDWKLLHNSPFLPLELFQLTNDEREEEDLSSNHESVKNELAELIQHQILRSGSVPWKKRKKREE